MTMNALSTEETTETAVIEPGSDRDLQRSQAPLGARLDWASTEICMDFTCECGYYAHICKHVPHGSPAYYVTCFSCEQVYRFSPQVQMVPKAGSPTQFDVPNADGVRADLQWKGTYARLEFACACGHANAEERDFLDDVTCAVCGAHYACNDRIQAIPLAGHEVEAMRVQGITPQLAIHDDDELEDNEIDFDE